MDWQVTPEPADEAEREALVQAADEALDGNGDRPSAWWSSGLDDLGGGPAPQQAWREARVVEP
jgi:hypothetical protein